MITVEAMVDFFVGDEYSEKQKRQGSPWPGRKFAGKIAFNPGRPASRANRVAVLGGWQRDHEYSRYLLNVFLENMKAYVEWHGQLAGVKSCHILLAQKAGYAVRIKLRLGQAGFNIVGKLAEYDYFIRIVSHFLINLATYPPPGAMRITNFPLLSTMPFRSR